MKPVGRQILLGGLGARRLAIDPETNWRRRCRGLKPAVGLCGHEPRSAIYLVDQTRPMLHPMSPMGKTGNDRRRLPCPVYPGSGRQTRQPASAKGAHRSSADQLTHLAVAGRSRDQSTLSRRSSVAIEDKNQDALDLHCFVRPARADNDDLGRAHRKKSTSRRS